jgi:hypothetical protein
MLLTTDIPTDEERAAAHAAVPWGDAASHLAGLMRASLDNQSVDLIEATLGAPHARAAIVALYEGADVLLQSAIDLADALTARAVLARIDPHDPLGGDDARLNDPGKRRLPPRIARFRVEDAAVKAASAADHLVNAHLRLAWETNAATQAEMMAEFRRFYGTTAVLQTRRYRNHIVHRERPSYSEVRSFGRATRWDGGRFHFEFPPPQAAPLPSIEDWVTVVSAAGAATLDYADAMWLVARRWMHSVGVTVTQEGDEVRVRTTPGTIRPRETRDPGPFLVAAPS